MATIVHKVQNIVFVELQSDARVQPSFLSAAAVSKVNMSYSNTTFWVEMVHYSAKMNASSNILRIMTWLSSWDN